jgi:hypothetical protein
LKKTGEHGEKDEISASSGHSEISLTCACRLGSLDEGTAAFAQSKTRAGIRRTGYKEASTAKEIEMESAKGDAVNGQKQESYLIEDLEFLFFGRLSQGGLLTHHCRVDGYQYSQVAD